MKNGLIGVIMPIYNTEKYLKKSIKSVLKQTYANFVLVCVNDCSPDNSLGICKGFKRLDNRVFIVNKPKNEGVQLARFDGIEKARELGCEFVTFLDSDDWLQLGALERLVNVQKKHNADIVEGRFYRCWGPFKKESKGTLPEYADQDSVLIANPRLYEDYFISYFGINRLAVNMCGKLYRIELCDSYSVVNEYKMGEDLFTNMLILPKIRRYCYLNRLIYNYRWGGMTSKFNPHLLPDLKRMFVEKVNYARKLNYTKAFVPSAIEMKNVLFTYIDMRLDFQHSRESIEKDLEIELEDSVWSLYDELSSDYVLSHGDHEMKMVLDRDVRGILDCVDARRNALKPRIKRAVRKILAIIS